MGQFLRTSISGGGDPEKLMTLSTKSDEIFTVYRNGESGPEPLVTLTREKEMIFYEGYEPDEAARIFWAAISKLAPDLGEPGDR